MSSNDSPQRQYFLRIERGRTRHPERPITVDRFLIGAGSNCHLQLGGEMPILHSILVPVDEALWIDAVAPEPRLYVNRKHVQDGPLFAGDLVEIGDFVFSVGERVLDLPQFPEIDVADENVDLEELTAEDLADLLREEIRQIEELEASRISGLNALLQAAQAESQQTQPEFLESQTPVSVASSPLNPPLVAEDLDKRAAELDLREAALAERAEQLLRAQERLESYLQQLVAQSQSTGQRQDGDDSTVRRTA